MRDLNGLGMAEQTALRAVLRGAEDAMRNNPGARANIDLRAHEVVATVTNARGQAFYTACPILPDAAGGAPV